MHLDKTVTLLDSPGIVFSAAGGDAAAALRNCRKVGHACLCFRRPAFLLLLSC